MRFLLPGSALRLERNHCNASRLLVGEVDSVLSADPAAPSYACSRYVTRRCSH